MLKLVLWVALVLAAHTAHACRPSPEWMALPVEERVKRLYEEASFVAHIRIERVSSQDFQVSVIESFKGSKMLNAVGIDFTSCSCIAPGRRGSRRVSR